MQSYRCITENRWQVETETINIKDNLLNIARIFYLSTQNFILRHFLYLVDPLFLFYILIYYKNTVSTWVLFKHAGLYYIF